VSAGWLSVRIVKTASSFEQRRFTGKKRKHRETRIVQALRVSFVTFYTEDTFLSCCTACSHGRTIGKMCCQDYC
jgi:hypothetical protein